MSSVDGSAPPEVPVTETPAPAPVPEAPAPVAPAQATGVVAWIIRFRGLLTIAGVMVILDQIVKRWIVMHFHDRLESTQSVIPGLFDLILAKNPGAAWGMLGNLHPDSLRIGVFVAISIGAVIMVVWLAGKAKPGQHLLLISLGLVLGGALGNLVDRIVAGRVVDFLDFYTKSGWFMGLAEKAGYPCDALIGCHWPAFNVADISISTGVALLILEGVISKKSAPVPPAATT